jgi:hypothetical protein
MASVLEALTKSIDALSLKNPSEFLSNLKQILHAMAFYVSQSEAAVLECREAWHQEYTNALYADHVSQTSKPPPYHETRASDSRGIPYTRARVRHTRSVPEAQSRHNPEPQLYEIHRPNVPNSLQTIMVGTHPSFSDYY